MSRLNLNNPNVRFSTSNLINEAIKASKNEEK